MSTAVHPEVHRLHRPDGDGLEGTVRGPSARSAFARGRAPQPGDRRAAGDDSGMIRRAEPETVRNTRTVRTETTSDPQTGPWFDPAPASPPAPGDWVQWNGSAWEPEGTHNPDDYYAVSAFLGGSPALVEVVHVYATYTEEEE